MSIELNKQTHSVKTKSRTEHLTPKEYSILSFLMEHPNTTFTAQEIYETIWQETPYVCEGIIAVHLRHIREKIEEDPSHPVYIRSSWGYGYRFEQ